MYRDGHIFTGVKNAKISIACANVNARQGFNACGDRLFTVTQIAVFSGFAGLFEKYVPVFLAEKNIYRT